MDDDDAARDVMREGLEQAGYEVHAVADAGDALRLLARSEPDLVVTDWHMGGLHGAHVVSSARELQTHVPIVVVSGHLDQARTGVDPTDPGLYFLEKPFSIASLLELAERLTR